MQLQAEVKYDGYDDLPKQQEVKYADSNASYLKADVSTGKHYYDLNAASKTYSGPWLFGKQKVEVNLRGMRGQWIQWCPVPADVKDGVLLRGNVIYQNGDGSYRLSPDVYEGVIESEHGFEGGRYFVGRTQHTFVSNNLPGGQLRVVANLRIHLDQRLAYNPMTGAGNNSGGGQNYQNSQNNQNSNYNKYQEPNNTQPAANSYDSSSLQSPEGAAVTPSFSQSASESDSGF